MNAAQSFDIPTPGAETLSPVVDSLRYLNVVLSDVISRVVPVAEDFPREVSLTIALVELQNMHKRLAHVRQRFQVLLDDSLMLDGPTYTPKEEG